MIKIFVLLMIAVASNISVAQTPLDAEFSYQDSLETSGSSAKGQFDFFFVLFDAKIDGTGTNLAFLY